MNKQRNDKRIFLGNLGSVSRMKNGWQNYPTGSPKNTEGSYDYKLDSNPKTASPKGQTSGKSMNMKVKQVQPTPPPPISERMKFTIASLKLENRILNYQNNPIPKDPKERASSTYFRSSIQKRLVAGVILINTLENKCTTQKEIRERTGLSKGIVSKGVATSPNSI